MESVKDGLIVKLLGSTVYHIRKCMFRVLSAGPIPVHMAFILDGNRRYAKKQNLGEGMGHRAGFLSLMCMMKYCYELGVKYVTIYAFSIDNFKRRPEEVQSVMDLMLEKIEGLLKEESIAEQYGLRVYFVGNMKLLSEPVRIAAEKAMKATSHNSKTILLVCVAYTSTDEILHAAQESCEGKWAKIRSSVEISDDGEMEEEENDDGEMEEEENDDDEDEENDDDEENDEDDEENGEDEEDDVIKVGDVERHMYMGVAPDPDILVRTSGETRLSNFLLWQTTNCLLYSPDALWPEIGICHLIWAVMNFQRMHPYLEKKRKKP